MKYPIQVLFREYFEGILAAVFLALFLRVFVVNILYVPTENMKPGLIRGDFVIGWRLSYGFPLPLMKGERLNFKPPQAGDLISFRFPGDEEQIIIRRVIGLPGDRVKISKGEVFINDQPLPTEASPKGGVIEQAAQSGQPYSIVPNDAAEMAEIQVPEDGLFVLSDNRLRTDDSRDWGMVPLNNIESEVWLIWLSIDNSQEGVKVLWPRLFQQTR